MDDKFNDLGKKLNDSADKFMNLGAKLTLGVTTPIVFAGKKIVDTASDFVENINKIDVVFGNSAEEVKKWGNEMADQLNLSKNLAYSTVANFGDMATSMGFSQAKAKDLAISLTTLGADLASFKNIDIKQAMTALSGVFTGETEALKTLGIVMTETQLEEFAKKTGVVYKEMTLAEKVQHRFNYVMSQTKNAQGDAVRTSNEHAGSVRSLSAKFENLSIKIGSILLPAATKLVQVTENLVDKFLNLNPIAQKTILITLGIIAVIGPLMFLLGGVVKMVLFLAKTVGLLTKGLALLKSAFLLINLPPLATIAIFLTLIGVGILLIKNFDAVKNSFIEVGKGIIQVFSNVLNFVKNIFVGGFQSALNVASTIVNVFYNAISGIFNGIKQIFSGIINFIQGVFTANWSQAWQGVVDIFGGIMNTLGSVVKAPLNGVISLVNMAIGGLNKISVSIPSWVPGIGGKTFGVNLPQIPYLLHGTDNWKGGFARMNEGGRGELVNLPNGTQVIPHDISRIQAKETARLNLKNKQNENSIYESINIPITVNTFFDGNKITERIYNYVVKKIGLKYKAVIKSKGG